MSSEGPTNGVRYVPPPATDAQPRYLVGGAAGSPEGRYVFYERLEVGRAQDGRENVPGLLLVEDPTVSFRHCVVSQSPDGRCFMRDVSRNGTRLDGRRLVPNVEAELQLGQVIGVGMGHTFRLDGELSADATSVPLTHGRTAASPGQTIATVLVGDIRDYTVLVRKAPSAELQRSVSSVFEELTNGVIQSGGTVKEYQGDAIFAFWEGALGGDQAGKACSAALALDELARRIAQDTTMWNVPGFELRMDWALATGPVVIDTFGGRVPTGLSMIGEPVVLAFRMEKFADDATGSILVCPSTKELASAEFEFRDLGLKHAKGFDQPDHVFSLIGAK
jgi:class 3 adenylate cyclase